VFCKEKVNWIDYKDENLLKRYISDRGKIRARRVSGNCIQHQRDISVAVKTARELALIPYALRMVTSKVSAKRRDDDDEREDRPRGPRNERDSASRENAVPAAYKDVVADLEGVTVDANGGDAE
jgi:small subunit ribosomal protein S18